MNTLKWILGGLAVIVVILALSLGFGWFDVFYIKTVGKEKQDAKREVFENTQSYVEGKRQEALKLYKEHSLADAEDKKAIESIVVMSFANFDEGKLPPELRTFVYNCKYN